METNELGNKIGVLIFMSLNKKVKFARNVKNDTSLEVST